MLRTNRARRIEKPGPPRLLSTTATAEPGRTATWVFALGMLLALTTGTTSPARASEPAEAASPAAPPPEAAPPAATAEPPDAPADRVTLGVDLVSRYAWRGQVYGDSPCFQPWAGVSVAGFTLNTWGSLPFTPVHSDTTTAAAGPADATSFTEVDLSISRSQALSIGTITATVTSYHYPSAGNSFFEFAENGTGGHIVDVGVFYRGPESRPLGLSGSVNVYNDDDHAAYVEASWPIATGSTDVVFTAGAALGKSALYDVDKNGVHVIQAAVAASKPLKISDAFAPTLKVSWILNPYRERVVLVAALSL